MFKSLKNIKIYHIVHINRLNSILTDGYLYCDVEINKRQNKGPMIGISQIKERRLIKNLSSFPGLTVGQCVPFYFSPRSIMLYVIKMANHPDLKYLNGQDDIVHLEFNLLNVLNWANKNGLRTCYTTSNAGSNYFEDFSDFSTIMKKIDWNAINARQWSGNGIDKTISENKQAEFLIENKIPIDLIDFIGVKNLQNINKVNTILEKHNFTVSVREKADWYY